MVPLIGPPGEPKAGMAPRLVATSVELAGADAAWIDAGGRVNCVDVSGVVVVVVLVLAALVGGAAVRRLEWAQAGSSMQMASATGTSSRCRGLM